MLRCWEKELSGQALSLFFSLVKLVKKNANTWRLCVDYRAVNEKIVKDKFSIPLIEELIDELNVADFFSKLDLRSRYH